MVSYKFIYLYYLSGVIFFILSICFFMLSLNLLMDNYSYFYEWSVMMMNSMNMNMYLYIDWVSLMFLFTVLLISSMIMFYCNEYMESDSYSVRFFYLVFFFILSMMLMILSPNMVSILIGWDGLGLISYMLVIYYNSISSYNSGMLTVLMNRVGDVMILVSIGMMMHYGSWNFLNFNNMESMILILVMVAAFTKSAQFPFSSWLPAAMAAPTPVSSLVHSSTLVTAGVYLLFRFQYLFNSNDILLYYITVTGMLTMFMAGITAMFEYDLKKIIAYSTLSQLGMMMVIFGMKQYDMVFFHLVVHAIFKSMMFMCSGIIIHSMGNYQDIRFMGCVSEMMPITFMILMIASFSLCGLPFMSGFYSKDMIVEFILLNKFPLLMKFLLLLSVMLTLMYSFRMGSFLMGKFNSFFSYKFMGDSLLMSKTLMMLMLLTLMFGMLMKWIIFMNIEEIFISQNEKFLFFFICLSSIFLGIFFWMFSVKFKLLVKLFFSKMWFFNILINELLYIIFYMNKKFIYSYESGWSEYFFKNNFMNLFNSMYKFSYMNNSKLMMLLMSMTYFLLLMMII